MSRKEEIKELFSFTSGERKGILVLMILIIIAILFNMFTDFKSRTKPVDFESFEDEISAFENSLKEKTNDDEYLSRLDKFIIAKYDSLTLFKFNPNTTSDKEWQQLGLTEKQISTIKNYLNKGGKFYDKNDFRKMYGIRSKQFEILKPYIDLPDESNYVRPNYSRYNKPYNYDKNKTSDKIPAVTELFKFNPNTCSETDWAKLGFSEKQVATIKNYLNKGGKFYKKSDLQKIYGITDFQYERVKDYIDLPENKSDKKYEPVTVDINALSGEEMLALGGFWKYNGMRIAKFRDALGGFTHKEQLLDVYGVKKKYYDRIAENVIVGNIKLKKIRVNFASKEEFAAHPYIDYQNAQKIIEFRDKHGFIKDLEILRKNKVIPQNLFDKIKAYLTVK